MLSLLFKFLIIVLINDVGENISAVKSMEDYKAAAHLIVMSISVEDAINLKDDVVMVEVRKEEELDRYGIIPGGSTFPAASWNFISSLQVQCTWKSLCRQSG